MNYTKKLLRITMFGIENNYVLIGIILLISCFLMPAFTVLTIMNNNSSLDDSNAQIVIKVYGTILAYFEGFALPLGLFSYIHKRRQCDFYNAMPVRRSQYFWGYTITGIIVFLVSFSWMCLAHFVISGFRNILPCLLQPVIMFLIIYCSMILAVCFSGSVMSTIVAFILRNAVFISITLMPLITAGVDAESYFALLGKKICILTPVLTVGVWESKWYDVMLLQLLVAVIELVTAFFLHSHRKSETTTALAFPKSRYPFQYTVMLMAALLTDALLSSIMVSQYFYTNKEIYFEGNDIYMFILLTAIVILVAFMFLNIIIERSGRAAFSKIRHLFIFSVCYGLILFTLFNYIAPNIPYDILPFKPDCAIICVRNIIITKDENDYSDGYYSDDLGSDAEIPTQSYGDYYTISETANVEEAYCVTDSEILKKLVDLVQSGGKYDENLFVSDYKYDYPYSVSKDNLYSVQKYDVYFLKGDLPYIQEGMSIFNFDDFDDIWNDDRDLRYCFTRNNNRIMEQFKEIRLDTKGLKLDTSTFNVFLPNNNDEEIPPLTKEDYERPPEFERTGITWIPSDIPPETSDITAADMETLPTLPITEPPVTIG